MESHWILPKDYSSPVWIARGGFAEVYRLRSNVLGREVAWKIFHAGTSASQLSEARKLSQLQSSIIPKVYNVGKWKGLWYLEMEWIPGVSLHDLFASIPRKKDLWALIFLRILNSINVFHTECGAHGDIQPCNILFPPKRNPVLLDPGGRGWMALGTPKYLAPEIAAQGGTPSPSSDYYSYAKMGREAMGDIAPEIIWDTVLDSTLDRAGNVLHLRQSLENLVSDRTELVLDQKLEEAYCVLMAARCSQSAALGIKKFPEQALMLCQEALGLNPAESLSLALLPNIHIKARSVVRWLLPSIILILILGGIAAWFELEEKNDLQKQRVEIRNEMHEKELLIPVSSNQTKPFNSGNHAVFRESTHEDVLDSGWLVIPKILRSCEIKLSGRGALDPSKMIPMVVGSHKATITCPNRMAYEIVFLIHPFAETILPLE